MVPEVGNVDDSKSQLLNGASEFTGDQTGHLLSHQGVDSDEDLDENELKELEKIAIEREKERN